MLPVRLRLPLEMLAQPDEVTCGPTCLHAIYRYWDAEDARYSTIRWITSAGSGG